MESEKQVLRGASDFKLFTIPNILTCLNVACGSIAIILSFIDNEMLVIGAFFVFFAAIFDFLDGMVARLLKAFSPIGKDLDSLADMISFGLAPGVFVFHLFLETYQLSLDMLFSEGNVLSSLVVLGVPLLVPMFSALRLAKFNIDTRQSDSFIGLPTPANAMFLVSLPVVLHYFPEITWLPNVVLSPWTLVVLVLFLSIMLISEFPMFSLKFKNLKFKGNEIRFIFIGAAFMTVILFWLAAVPIIIFMFIVISLISNLLGLNKKNGAY